MEELIATMLIVFVIFAFLAFWYIAKKLHLITQVLIETYEVNAKHAIRFKNTIVKCNGDSLCSKKSKKTIEKNTVLH